TRPPLSENEPVVKYWAGFPPAKFGALGGATLSLNVSSKNVPLGRESLNSSIRNEYCAGWGVVPPSTVHVCTLSPASGSVPGTWPVRVGAAIGASSVTEPAPGPEITGASLTGVTVIATVSWSCCAPPDPVAPPSLVVIVSVSLPLKFAAPR